MSHERELCVSNSTASLRLRNACVTRLLPLLLLLALPAVVQAQYNYTTNNGTITITKYTGSGGAVTIPSAINGLPVTSIGSYAFGGCTSLTNVLIGNSVTSIGASAFSSCNSLASITIPNSVTNIEYGAFHSCTRLTSVTIPNSVASIGDSTFHSCTRLTSVTIPNSVTNIGRSAFNKCTSLTSVTIGNSVTSIGASAFYDCTSLTNVLIGNSVTNIGAHAFSSCTSLTSITIPSSVTRIESAAFYGCTSLKGVYFTGNAPSIGSDVFSGNPKAIIYYLAETTGWGPAFGRRQTTFDLRGPNATPVKTKLTAERSDPVGIILIPEGSFTMGDTFSEGEGDELLHNVQVSAFYMEKHEVTKALWDKVKTWAVTNDYNFENDGSGENADYPVHRVSWYDAVKWCNARSEKEGRVPAYYTGTAQTKVYRTGRCSVQNDWVKWNAGYRLPTEAEWEKAARGGFSGKRFPWTVDTVTRNGTFQDAITHRLANYDCAVREGYNYSEPEWGGGGLHPKYVGAYTHTSPVGSFAPNGYGLHDMAGNVWEWCWDYYSSRGSQTDPRGPNPEIGRSYRPRVYENPYHVDEPADRAHRGGGWRDFAAWCRVAKRSHSSPDTALDYGGFRCVLGFDGLIDEVRSYNRGLSAKEIKAMATAQQAAAAVSPAASDTPPKAPALDRLKQVKELYEKEFISKEDYDKKVQEIIDSL